MGVSHNGQYLSEQLSLSLCLIALLVNKLKCSMEKESTGWANARLLIFYGGNIYCCCKLEDTQLHNFFFHLARTQMPARVRIPLDVEVVFRYKKKKKEQLSTLVKWLMPSSASCV